MTTLIDTNVVLSLLDPDHALHALVANATTTLQNRGAALYVCAQVIIEYWGVATRPQSANGMGMSVTEVSANVDVMLRTFGLLPEPHDVAVAWRKLAEAHGVSGKQVHDARLVTVMLAHGLDRILTLNGADFARHTDITAVHPSEV